MALSKKQEQLDVTKWLGSEDAGHDLCGEFDFCEKCDKTVENPCAKAYDLYDKHKKAMKKAEEAALARAKEDEERAAREAAEAASTPAKKIAKRKAK